MQSILIVDDMESIHEMLDTIIQPLGFSTHYASNGNDALELFQKERPEIILVDIKMSPMDGLELTKKLKEIDPEAIVIIMSGQADIENALVSLKLGVFDFLTKPFKLDQLLSAISRASNQLKSQRESEGEDDALRGHSSAIRKLNQTIDRVANSTAPVLLHGETGTQKSLVAGRIHRSQANRESDSPFVSYDCKENSAEAIREQLLGEDDRGGPLLQKADSGTLVLANIDALPAELQSKVGNLIRDTKTQTRIICSTSKSLELLVEKNEFDDSLYYRISSLVVEVPSLRQRAEDIPMIANSILRACGMEALDITDPARALLQAYRWPGNFKELQEAVEHAAAHCSDDTIRVEDLPERVRDTSAWPKLAEYIEEATLEYKRRVLQACCGDTEQAAQILGCQHEQVS